MSQCLSNQTSSSSATGPDLTSHVKHNPSLLPCLFDAQFSFYNSFMKIFHFVNGTAFVTNGLFLHPREASVVVRPSPGLHCRHEARHSPFGGGGETGFEKAANGLRAPEPLPCSPSTACRRRDSGCVEAGDAIRVVV